jgi:hypothetical protein
MEPIRVRKARADLEYETNATVKMVMLEMERLAAADPAIASEPQAFNTVRHAVIRKIWNLVKEAVRYGVSSSVQRDEYRE